jgi:hypothetical protein
MLTMEPPTRRRIDGTAARLPRKVPTMARATLSTSTETEPKAASAVATTAVQSGSLVTSSRANIAPPR